MMNNTPVKLDKLPGSKLYQNPVLLSPLVMRDISELEVAVMQNDENRLFDLIQMKVTGVRIDELTISDFWYVLWVLRIMSYQHIPVKRVYTCPKCNTESKVQVDENSLDYKLPDEEYLLNKGSLDVELYNGDIIKLKLKTVGIWRKWNLIKDNTTISADRFMLSQQIEIPNEKCIQGATKEESTLKYISELSADDYVLIRDIINEYEYGIKDTFIHVCDKCNHQNKLSSSLSLKDLFPFGRGITPRSRVLPRNKSTEPIISRDSGSDIKQTTPHIQQVSKRNIGVTKQEVELESEKF